MELQEYEKEHLDLVAKTAGECTVLLKNDGSFPLEKPCPIDAYGSGIRHTIKGGTGSGEVNSRFSVNVENGLKDAGFNITSSSWLDRYDAVRTEAMKAYAKQLKAEAKALHVNSFMYSMGKTMPEPEHEISLSAASDTAIYVVSRNSGEGNDRQAINGDILLSRSEIRDILKCNELYPKFMLVLNVGGVVDLTEVKDVKNILLLSQLGVVTGNVLSDILLGKQVPSGKLTTTWASWKDYSKEGNFGDPNDTDYAEGIYVGYRYFDSVGKKPLFPFGYGISYTEFTLSPASVKVDGLEVSVFAQIKNSGRFRGKETLQVYVSTPWGKLDKPYQELAAFTKTKELLPGESQTVTASFNLKDLASYNSDTASYILEEGCYTIRVGNSSASTSISAILRLDKTCSVLVTQNVFGKPGFDDFKPKMMISENEDISSAPVYAIDSSLITAQVLPDKVDYPVDDIISALSDEEIALLSVGSHDPNKKGMAAVIGNASPHLAGAAGESTSGLKEKGIKYITMSDGPAGLRLAKDYYVDNEGAHGIGSSMIPESMRETMGGFTKFLMGILGLNGKKAPKNANILHQYATAIPIGTAIAQSFNEALAQQYGDMVGSEMEMFKVNLWLAPGMNIHRSIQCGRNFEYFSEDPLVSGLMAGAITKGVQEHKGCGTTIKHYAANNQEINRYGCSSNVSERALREIYLKGFGICVRKAQPHAVMTSYNLINGTHTSEHRGLLEDVLRKEYGFEGIVMTDWVIPGMAASDLRYRGAIASEVCKAGGDIFMPGSKGDYDNVLAAIKEGSLDREQLNINCTRTYRMIELLTK